MKNQTIIKEAKCITRLMTYYENKVMDEERKEEILQNLDNVLFALMSDYADNEIKKGFNHCYTHATIYFRRWIETGE